MTARMATIRWKAKHTLPSSGQSAYNSYCYGKAEEADI